MFYHLLTVSKVVLTSAILFDILQSWCWIYSLDIFVYRLCYILIYNTTGLSTRSFSVWYITALSLIIIAQIIVFHILGQMCSNGCFLPITITRNIGICTPFHNNTIAGFIIARSHGSHKHGDIVLFRLDALALSVIATATWLGGWVAGWLAVCHSRYCIKTTKPIRKLFGPSGRPII